MKQIGIILNPSAKINSRKTTAVIKKLDEIFGGKALLRTTKNKLEIPGVMEEFHDEGVKLLLISGGDGTICSVLSTYLKLFGDDKLPVILPLMGGTINMIGSDAGLRESQFAICRKLNDIQGAGIQVASGRVPADRADSYREFLLRKGLLDYAATPGNRGIFVFRRVEGSVAHFLLTTFWDSYDAIRKFAGDDFERARYYP